MATASTTVPDLFACVVFLEACADTVLPASQGQHAHAAFLELVRAAEPALAEVLHDTSGRKPFTVSPLGGLGEPRGGLIPVRAGGRCWLRFTLLEPSLFRALRATLLGKGADLRLRIGPGTFAVTGAAGTPGSHPWAGAVRADELLARGPLREVTLEFSTPTAWSVGGTEVRRMELLPIPALVFGGLSSAWNVWCSGAGRIGPELRAFAESSLAVSRMRIETRALWFGGRPQLGTVGTVTYSLLGPGSGREAAQLRALADFAFYAGVGYRTTMGMGQVRRLAEVG